MYFQTNNPAECCGCTACQQVCPTKCIEMRADQEGFLYPVMDKERCINCHKCEKVCPLNIAQKNESKPICFGGWNKNNSIRKQSTSGGAFSAIVSYAEKFQYKHIWGVAYDDLHAVHCEVTAERGISEFTRSKYVQSELRDTFQLILAQLKADEKVLFSGTPCQVQGLLNTIPERYKQNLLTIALICHGVSSPAMFRAYKKELEAQKGVSITEFRFRDKRELDGILRYNCTTVVFEDGTEQVRTDDPYTVSFGRGFMQRESCFHCPFTTVYRNADITIGDFWGIEQTRPELLAEKPRGISVVLAHTPKGQETCENLKVSMELFEVAMEDVLMPAQEQLIRPARRPFARNRFIRNILQNGKPFAKEVKIECFLWKFENMGMRVKRKIVNILKG